METIAGREGVELFAKEAKLRAAPLQIEICTPFWVK